MVGWLHSDSPTTLFSKAAWDIVIYRRKAQFTLCTLIRGLNRHSRRRRRQWGRCCNKRGDLVQ